MEIVIWLIVGLLIGGVIGGLATWWISRARGGAVSVMQLKQENDKFKNEVTDHFVETARLINQMTDSYKQVFDHLSSGAEKLVDEKSLAERLPPGSGEEVKLRQFGASASAAAGDDKAGPSTSGASESDRARAGDGAKASDSPDPLKRPGRESSVAGPEASDKRVTDPGEGPGGQPRQDSAEKPAEEIAEKSDDNSGVGSDDKSPDKSSDSKEKSASGADQSDEKSRAKN